MTKNRLLMAKQVAEILNITIEKLNNFPTPETTLGKYRCGNGSFRYVESKVLAWKKICEEHRKKNIKDSKNNKKQKLPKYLVAVYNKNEFMELNEVISKLGFGHKVIFHKGDLEDINIGVIFHERKEDYIKSKNNIYKLSEITVLMIL